MDEGIKRRSFLRRCFAAGALPFAGVLGLGGTAKAAGPVVTLVNSFPVGGFPKHGGGHVMVWSHTFEIDGFPVNRLLTLAPGDGGLEDVKRRMAREWTEDVSE